MISLSPQLLGGVVGGPGRTSVVGIAICGVLCGLSRGCREFVVGGGGVDVAAVDAAAAGVDDVVDYVDDADAAAAAVAGVAGVAGVATAAQAA